MRNGKFLLGIWMLLGLLSAGLQGQEDRPKPEISPKPLTSEQIAVYHAVLTEWIGHEHRSVNLQSLTDVAEPGGMSGYGNCAKKFKIETPSQTIHRFLATDAERLVPGGVVQLIDPRRGTAEVRANDPESSMRKGKSVDEAVENGFAHGLFSLSEIVFDEEHLHAIVSYGFVCGGLCGHGETVVLEKVNGAWRRMKLQCGSSWIS